MVKDEEKPIPIPEKFRASTDAADEAAHARLLQNDAEQKALSERVNSPFTRASPLDVERSKAQITIDVLSQVKRTKEQTEQFAEAWATIGNYDVALAVTKDRAAKKRYKQIIVAIERDDNATCLHPPQNKFVVSRIYSAKHGREKSLIKCNLCGDLNCTTTPAHVKKHQSSQAQHQGQNHDTIESAKDYHQQNVKK